jgi:hypothetical protein
MSIGMPNASPTEQGHGGGGESDGDQEDASRLESARDDVPLPEVAFSSQVAR